MHFVIRGNMRILLLALSILFATVAYAQDTAGQQQLLLNDKGNVIIGTTTATGETRIIHNGTIVLTTTSGGVDLGASLTTDAIANAVDIDVDIDSTTVATFDSGGLVLNGYTDLSHNIYTAAGSDQSGAVAITTSTALVTGATGTEGARLPTSSTGRIMFVYNSGGGVLKLYPASGQSINGLGANTAVDVASNAMVLCFSRITGNQNWRCGEMTAA